MRGEHTGPLDAVVVGAGFSGMAATIELDRLGYHNLLVVEREDDLGGTWHVNRYPGIGVDIASASYQYWFEPNPYWSRVYCKGDELKAYADHVADKYDVRRRVRFNTAVEHAEWDDSSQLWQVTLSDGEVVCARFLVSASGILSQRHYPDIDGLESFEGDILHTTGWDPQTDLRGRRVGLVGTGATAVQLLPEIAEEVDSITVYQRTPIWVTPKIDFPMPRPIRSLLGRLPAVNRLFCKLSDTAYDLILRSAILNHRRFSLLGRLVELQSRTLLRLTVRDADLRKKLTPDYSFGCKRPSLSNNYFRTYTKPHVHLETAGIARIESDAVVSHDGGRTEVDTLILATGFNVWDHNFPAFPIVGRDGLDLGEWWRKSRYVAYQGVTVPNFPNLITMTCPWAYTGVSYFSTIQTQTAHMDRLLGELQHRGATTFEVKDEAATAYVDRMRGRLPATVLQHGDCASSRTYYYNEFGEAAWFRLDGIGSALTEQRTFPFDDYLIA